MKDHEIRELVNHLRDIAVAYHDHDSLRERIAHVVKKAIRSDRAQQSFRRFMDEYDHLK